MFGVGLGMLIVTVVLVMAAGGLAAYVLRGDQFFNITVPEFIIAVFFVLTVMVPGVSFVGTKVAQTEAVNGYIEFWNGSLVSAEKKSITCERDGSCRYDYDCDPYTVQVPETRYRTVPDGKGGTKSESYTVMVDETRYHSCPYTTRETSYWVTDSFGDKHELGEHWFDENPKAWRGGKSIPSDVPRGVPTRWSAAKQNIDAGDPDPVTKLNKYTNYLLASQDTILKQYSDQVATYKEAGLLPHHTRNILDEPIYDSYKADKLVTAGGLKLSDNEEWQAALGRLNSRLGNERQGDLHVLVVPADKIDSPDSYLNAVLAYWQGPDFDKRALAKNTVMLVIGLDETTNTVAWSRAKTGIPQGNGAMLSALSTNLVDRPFEPRTLLGWPSAKVSGDELTFTPSGGAVEQIILTDYPFLRPCMNCDDKGDVGTGYVYLKTEAHISTFAKVVICIFVFLLSCGLFAVAAATDVIPLVRSWAGHPVYEKRRRNANRYDKFDVEPDDSPSFRSFRY